MQVSAAEPTSHTPTSRVSVPFASVAFHAPQTCVDGIGESVAAMTFAPEMVGAAGGSSVDIVIAELGGDPVTGNEEVTAEFIGWEPAAFTDFTKSFKEGALHIEFTMPNVEAEFLGFTVSAAK